MVQGDRSKWSPVLLLPTTGAGKACILLMAGKGFGPLSLPTQRLRLVSLRKEPAFCPTWNALPLLPSFLWTPRLGAPFRRVSHPTNLVLGVRILGVRYLG